MGSIFEALTWVLKTFFKLLGFVFKWIGWYLGNIVDLFKNSPSSPKRTRQDREIL